MPESFELRILRPQDLQDVLVFAQSSLEKSNLDPMERQFAAWSAPWRQEALEHYLSTGWSFAVYEGEQLLGFALAQALLFFQSQTQSVWVEHLDAENESAGRCLVESLYRWSRDKHMQKLIFQDAAKAKAWSENFNGQTNSQNDWWEIATTKMKS